jgi:hypothetical protein
MVPTSVADTNYDTLWNTMWGLKQDNDSFDGTLPTSLFRIPINFPTYFCALTPSEIATTEAPDNQKMHQLGWSSRYSNNIQFYQMSSETAGSVVYEDSYHFTFAPLNEFKRDAYEYRVSTYKNTRGRMDVHENVASAQRPGSSDTTADQGGFTQIQNTSRSGNPSPVSYGRLLERSQIYSTGMKAFDIARQPTCHVGIRAVPKLTTSTNDIIANKFTDVQAWWEITCELDIEYDFHNEFTFGEEYFVRPTQQITYRGDQQQIEDNQQEPLLYKDSYATYITRET